jgi:enoyl-CoA hydratase/carnithine racemase
MTTGDSATGASGRPAGLDRSAGGPSVGGPSVGGVGHELAGGPSVGGVRHELAGGILTVLLDRPEKRNALDRATRLALTSLWERYRESSDLRCVVLGATGSTFCAGADVDELRATSRPDASAGPDASLQHLPTRWLGVPVVVAVNGPCLGLGLDLVADGDLVVAAEDAWFADPHVKLGLTSAVSALLLSSRMSAGALSQMVLLGLSHRLAASEARDCGLVDAVVPPGSVAATAGEWAGEIAAASPAAVRRSVAFLRRLARRHVAELLEGAWLDTAEHWTHPDATEGLRAFAEKRSPRWADV